MKTLKVQQKYREPTMYSCRHRKTQQGLEADTLRCLSGNMGCMTAVQCEGGCSLGSMHTGGTAFCSPFPGYHGWETNQNLLPH